MPQKRFESGRSLLRDRNDRLNRRLPDVSIPGRVGSTALLRQECLAASMGGDRQTFTAPRRSNYRSQTMKNFLKNFVRDESGASAAEYALILAIVGTGIAGAAVYLGGEIRVKTQSAS